jgi:hypothetical protein
MARTHFVIPAFVAGLSVAAGAYAQPANRPPTLEVVIDNRAPGGAMEIGTARTRAGFIFGEAGIRIAWVLQGEAGRVALDADERVHLVVIDERADGLIAGNPRRLGFAMPSANRAYVHYDRVHKLARAHYVQPGWFLGVVIAHELAHLLFQGGGHAETGVMARALSPDPAAPAVFTRQEAQRLRDHLRRETTLALR